LSSLHAALEVNLSEGTCSLMMYITARGATPGWKECGNCHHCTRRWKSTCQRAHALSWCTLPHAALHPN